MDHVKVTFLRMLFNLQLWCGNKKEKGSNFAVCGYRQHTLGHFLSLLTALYHWLYYYYCYLITQITNTLIVLLLWLSVKGFICALHFLIPLFLYGSFYLSISCVFSLCVCVCVCVCVRPVKLGLLRLWGGSLCTSWDSCLTGPTNDTSQGLVGS